MRATLLSTPTPLAARPQRTAAARRGAWGSSLAARSHRVELELADGTMEYLEVPEGETILNVALDKGLDIPYDCNMGVCLRCAAKLEEGEVDQQSGMLDEEVQQKGFALLCMSLPLTNCKVRVIPEEELMDETISAAATAASEAAKA